MSHTRLALNQRDIWYDQTAYPDSPLYNIGGTLIMSGHVDYSTLNAAIKYLIDENDAFRLTICHQVPVKQKLSTHYDFELEFIDFSSHPDPKNKAEEWINQSFQVSFKLNTNNLLWHFALIKESDQRYYLMTKYHHLIADGWSTTVVISRLAEIYNALLYKTPISKNTAQHYFEFIQQEQNYLNSAKFKVDEKFWQTQLPVAPEPLIPRRYSENSNTLLPKAHIHRFKLPYSFYQQINQFSLQHKTTIYPVFLSALIAYLNRIYQRQDIIIGVPSLNRNGARFKDVLGLFISLSPLVITIPQEQSCLDILHSCQTQLRQLYKHHRFPLNEISQRLELLQNGRDTLFDIILSYEKHQYTTHYGEAKTRAKQQFSGVARYPLAVTICEFDEKDDVEIILEGAENCFTVQDLTFLANRLRQILEQFICWPNRQITTLDLLTPEDKQLVFSAFNRQPEQPTEFISVIQRFQRQVARCPHHIAVEFEGLTLSYQQLDRQICQLSNHLQVQIKEPDAVIAICLPRCLEMVVAILASLKLSATYLPISLDNPDSRIKNILQQAQVSCLLTTHQYQERLNKLHSQTLSVDRIDKNFHNTPSTTTLIRPDQLAYILFTSGSTGQPKGVMIDHGALSSRLDWLQSIFNITSSDRVGQTIPFYFDPSIIEIFLALTQGATLVLVPENQINHQRFTPFICQQRITVVALVPSSLRLLLNGLNDSLTLYLRVACCGGERLAVKLANQFLQQTSVTLFNVYGPTETTIIASVWQCYPNFKGLDLPLGKPVDHSFIHIADRELNLLPVNVEGEIIISGDGLSRGYLNQPQQTEQAFPFCQALNARVYRTGDTGYIAHDGLLYFSGRQDRQVKISGYRIELGEIEVILQQHKEVSLAAAHVREKGYKRLIYAYVETQSKQVEQLVTELSLLLQQHLPNYMQPQSIIPLKVIETTATGKINYSKLPLPEDNNVSDRCYRSPRNLLEQQLQRLWIKVLDLSDISIDDNFFRSGGDSLSAISLMLGIEHLTETRYPLSFLLSNPTIAQQALALKERNFQQVSRTLLPLNSNDRYQPILFVAASGEGDYLRLSNLADSLDDFCQIYMLQPPQTNEQLSIHAIAQHYADKILTTAPRTYHLSGFSIGGITALETAKILAQTKYPPNSLILMDSIYPRWPLQSPTLFKIINFLVNRLNLSNTIINNRRLSSMLNDPGIQIQINALPNHTITPVKLPTALILTKGMWMFQPLFFSSWQRLFKDNLVHHKIAGLHGEIFHPPYLQNLVATLKTIMQESR